MITSLVEAWRYTATVRRLRREGATQSRMHRPPTLSPSFFTNQQQPQDRILHLLPLHHLHGVVNKLLCVLYAGGVVEFPREGQTRAADILRRLASWEKEEDERLTLFMAVPTIYSLLMEGASYAYIHTFTISPPTHL